MADVGPNIVGGSGQLGNLYLELKRSCLRWLWPEANLLAMARAMGELATEDVEASRAFRFAVHFFAAEEMMTESLVARVMAWMAEKRTAVNNDPRIVPRILDVAEPITVPTW